MEVSQKQFKKRNAILACLNRSPNHPSAEMVYQMLRQEHPEISLATVYRNLAWFRSHGLAQSVGTVNGVERFDGRVHPHVHFICQECGAVLDLPQASPPMAAAKAVSEELGLEIQGFQLSYTGICNTCRSIRAAELKSPY